MMSDGQLITALTGLMSLSKVAKQRGIRLVRTPRTLDDDIQDLNHEFRIIHRSEETNYYVQIGMGEMTFDHFDGETQTEIARLQKEGLATPMLDFVAKILNTFK